MANYCDNDDLVEVRPDILQLGVDDWTTQIAKATAKIDRDLQTRWYNDNCREYSLDYRETPFDSDLLLNKADQLTDLGVYKSLQLIYLYLAKNAPKDKDAFMSQSMVFRDMYKEELADVLAQGLDYDWDNSGDIGYTEKYMPSQRRLSRC